MNQALFVAGWMLLSPVLSAADKIEPLEGDFLDYLANLEADDDNWTLLTEAVDEPEDTDRRLTQPRKPTTEAAKPAEDDR